MIIIGLVGFILELGASWSGVWLCITIDTIDTAGMSLLFPAGGDSLEDSLDNRTCVRIKSLSLCRAQARPY